MGGTDLVEIKSKSELIDILYADRLQYFKNGKITVETKYRNPVKYQIYRYIASLRKYEYYCFRRDHSSNPIIAKLWSIRVKNADRKKQSRFVSLY